MYIIFCFVVIDLSLSFSIFMIPHVTLCNLCSSTAEFVIFDRS
jgi:hypothetical protein